MSRIKKRGLDYFPISTDFIHDRIVRRIMKKEGDAAVTVLVQAFCSIYSNEGYYVMAGDLFYDDLAGNLYQEDSDYVRRVIALAVEYGLFDSALFQEYGLLTSADIQRQFLFATKRRNSSPRRHRKRKKTARRFLKMRKKRNAQRTKMLQLSP